MMKYISIDEHNQIEKRFKNGAEKLTPLWHINKEDIDFKKTATSIDPALLEDGFDILNVNAELLMRKMGPLYVKLYQGKLYREPAETKISQVLYHWINGEKLIPPIIIVHDNIFNSTTNAIVPQDGNHRLRAAYHFGIEEIPIIILDKQLVNFKKIMGI